MVGRMGSVVRLLALLVIVAAARSAAAQLVAVPFDSERWALTGGRMAEHLGRAALAGGAVLADVEFLDGTVEVDVAVTGSTSYPGIDFRVQPGGDGENVYLRPHRISRYGDSVQYAPKSGSDCDWKRKLNCGMTPPLTSEGNLPKAALPRYMPTLGPSEASALNCGIFIIKTSFCIF